MVRQNTISATRIIGFAFAIFGLILMTLNTDSTVYAQETKPFTVTSEPNNSYYVLFVIIPVIALAICVVYLNKRKRRSSNS